MRPFSAMSCRWQSRCVGAVSAVALGTAVERGGTTTSASGSRSATSAQTLSWSYAPSAVTEATGSATWSSKGPTWEASSSSRSVSVAATIRPVLASTPRWSFLQDRRLLVPCFSTSHSPAPESFSPVLSTSRCMGPVSRPAPPPAPSPGGFGRGTSSVSARRHRVVWSGPARASPSRPRTEPISPSVCRYASRNTTLNVSAVRIARSEYSGCPPRLVRRLGLPRLDRLAREPHRQAAAPAQALVVLPPVRDPALLFRDVMAAVLVQLEGQGGHPGGSRRAALLLQPGPGRHRPDPCNNAPYARRSKSLEVLIPILYLKGISSGNFEDALAALLGPDAGGLSASSIARLKEAWSDEQARWSKRDLLAKRYVYVWVDGIHVQARLEDDAQCLLVIIGATSEGKKELVGLIDGVRESVQSWRELLLDLRRRGLSIGPELAVADGALGFWQALEEVWPKTRGQRCWVHKTANVLNKLPKSQQPKAKRALQEIWMAETKKEALIAFDAFVETYGVKYDKAIECLSKDRDALLAFYDFPAQHWKHLRTTNVIESSFATVRHRTTRSKGCLSNRTALAMIFKLAEAAEKSWRRLDGHNQLPKVILGVKFPDGVEVVRSQAQAVAA